MTYADPMNDLKKGINKFAAELERERRVAILWLLGAIGAVSFMMTLVLLLINPEGIDLQYTVTFGAFVPSVIVYLLLSRWYLKKSRKSFIKTLCDASGFKYRPKGCFGIASAQKHGVIPPHSTCTMETGLQCDYRGTPLYVQELVLTALKQDPKHKKRQKEFLRFWGLVVRVDLKRTVIGHTTVIPKPVIRVFFNRSFSGYDIITVNDKRFDKVYQVTTNDKVDAKFLVNTAFREKMSSAQKKLNAYWCEASFKDNEILLVFQRFRPLIHITPLWKPVTTKNLRENIEELEALTQIVDALKSNQQLKL